MRVTARKATAALLATGLFAFSSAAMATNGYFTHGVGTESKGMAGTGAGSPTDMGGISIATNPALGVFADEQWQIGMAIFSPMRSYETSSSFVNGQLGAFTLEQGKFDSKNEVFPIPYIAKNWKLDSGNAITMVFYGRGGMNTEWDNGQSAFFDPSGMGGSPPPGGVPGLYGGGISGFVPGNEPLPVAGVDLMQAFLSINWSGKIGDSFAYGFGPVFAAQLFEATGLSAFAGYSTTYANYLASTGDMQTPPWLVATNGTDNGSDMSTGWGVAGGIWAGSERFSFGLAYQSKMSMSEFDDYADLFAEQGGFDIPSTLKAGISFMAGDSARINVDVEHIGYSEVDSIANPISNLFSGCFTTQQVAPPESSGCLGGPNGAGFGWQDVTVYKLGAEWASSDNNTWRVGYSYGEQPIPSSEVLFNILAPGVMEQHLTVGWTNRRSNGHVISMSLMYAPKTTIKGTNSFDPTQVITLEMQQLEFEFAYRF
jgi:long-chain fatty acid transport protein